MEMTIAVTAFCNQRQIENKTKKMCKTDILIHQ